MKSLVLILLLAVSLLAAAAPAVAQEPSASPEPSAYPTPSIAPGTDPATATRAWLDTVPADKRARSDAYFEGGYWLILWNFLLSAAISIFLLASRISARLRDFAERIVDATIGLLPEGRFRRIIAWIFRNALVVFLYAIPTLLLIFVLNFPLHYYENFVREHAYGMANQNLSQWLGEQLKFVTVDLIATSFLLVLLYAVFRWAPRIWWILGTIVSIIFAIILIMLSPVYIMPLFNKYTPLNDPAISEPILAMARANQIPVTQVFEVDASRQTKRVSANVAGFLGTTRIALNDNLLKRCTLPEIREVMAHEMGHYILNHSMKLTTYFSFFFLLGFLALRFFYDGAVRRWGAGWGLRAAPVSDNSTAVDPAMAPETRGPSGIADLAGLPLLSLIFSTVFFLLTPAVHTTIRVHEREADAFSVNTAREPDAFAMVALKLGEYRKLDPSPLEEFLFFDHPSGRARIRMAMDWKAAHLPAGHTE